MLLYVSGPYSGDVDRNIAQARQVAIALWEKGHAVICPHLNSAHMEQDCRATYDQFLAGDLMMIARCDGMVMAPEWEFSKGAKIEYEYAESLKLPVWEYPDLPDLHPTEVRCPNQVKAVAEVLGQMHRTHLIKNADYSPANVLGTGHRGLVTRLWDKVARYLNLTGWQVSVVQPDERSLGQALWTLIARLFILSGLFFQGEISFSGVIRDALNEPTDDALMDMSVYAIIGLLLRRRVWGK
jgi:hypothetical protein